MGVQPHEEAVLSLGFDYPKKCRYGVYVNTELKDSSGVTVGITQHKADVPVVLQNMPEEKAEITEDKLRFYVKANNTEYIINKRHGAFESIKKDGAEQLLGETALTVWRAPTDNDRHIKHKWGLYEDNQAAVNMNRLFSKVYSCEKEENKIVVNGSLAGVARSPFMFYRSEYEFYADGTVAVRLVAEVEEWIHTFLPRLGYEFRLKNKNAEFTYFGRGKDENYCDMNRHAPVGLYSSSAKEEYVNYVMPQEHGNHTECKMLSIKNGLKFTTNSEFEFNASLYTAEELTNGMHTDEIHPFGGTNLRIDYKVSGLGSASCGTTLIKDYELNDKHIEFEFFINAD